MTPPYPVPERCQTCRYGRAISHPHAEVGTCHRHAPTPPTHTPQDGRLTAWPVVQMTDWCAEWARKKDDE